MNAAATQVDIRVRRTLRPSAPSQRIKPQTEGAPLAVPLFRGKAGDTMARASLTQLKVREAIVRRNSAIDQAEAEEAQSALPPPSQVSRLSRLSISFARSRDQRQRLSRYGSDAILIEGIGSGASKLPGQKAALSVGIDGLIFTVAVEHGDTAKVSMERLQQRLHGRYELEVLHSSAHKALLRIVR